MLLPLRRLLMEKELANLGKLLENPERRSRRSSAAPRSATRSRSSSTARQVDVMIIGGGMATTFLLAQGKPVGKASRARPGRGRRSILARPRRRA